MLRRVLALPQKLGPWTVDSIGSVRNRTSTGAGFAGYVLCPVLPGSRPPAISGHTAVLALIGAGLAAAWSWARSTNRSALAHAILAVIGTAVLALAVLTWRQARIYQDQITLWSHTISLNDRAWAAYGNRGNAYNDRRAYDLAFQDCTRPSN